MEIIIIAILLGLIPALIARSKGRSFWKWWLYGSAIWLIAFPHSIIIGKAIPKSRSVAPPPPWAPWWEKNRFINRK